MVPIHDTDVAEERWLKAEWQNYELWEKIEFRLKRQKHLWIFSTFIVFIGLSAVPIVFDQMPKWATRSIARSLAQEMNQLKYEAIRSRAAYRLRFVEEGKLTFLVERLTNCSATSGEQIRTVHLRNEFFGEKYTWISHSQGANLEVPGLTNELCYDALLGNGSLNPGQSVIGFGIVSVKDLMDKRLDRLSVLLLTGLGAEISFD